MAQAPNFPVGYVPQPINGTPMLAVRLGNSTVLPTGASSATVALPVDSNGVQYAVVMVQSTAAGWFDFVQLVGDTIAAAAANTTLCVPGNSTVFYVVPPGAKFIAGIQDSAAGKICITGIF
jgi:hypothetical protein